MPDGSQGGAQRPWPHSRLTTEGQFWLLGLHWSCGRPGQCWRLMARAGGPLGLASGYHAPRGTIKATVW